MDFSISSPSKKFTISPVAYSKPKLRALAGPPFSFDNGTMLLTEIDKVKIVDDSNALDGALLDYAASLVGSYDNVYYQGLQQTNRH